MITICLPKFLWGHKNSVSSYFLSRLIDSINVFDCHLPYVSSLISQQRHCSWVVNQYFSVFILGKVRIMVNELFNERVLCLIEELMYCD